MWPEGPVPDLFDLLAQVERQIASGDPGAAERSLRDFDLALRALRADDLGEDRARALQARVGAVLDGLGAARARALAELAVVRRVRGYDSAGPSAGVSPGRWIEDRA